MKKTTVVFVLLCFAISFCKHDPAIVDAPEQRLSCEVPVGMTLQELLVGKWKGYAHKGFPYLDTLWHPYDFPSLPLELAADSSFKWPSGGQILTGKWRADQLDKTILFNFDQPNYGPTMHEFERINNCAFVFRHHTDEGLTYTMSLRVD
ncbi:MAG: hypothetical protein ACK4Q5_17680 [Saprospiraceae bacterium]